MKGDADRSGVAVDTLSSDADPLPGTPLDGSAPCPNCGTAGSGDGVLRPGQLWCGEDNCVVGFLGSEQC